MTLTIDMLPAREGDCHVVTWRGENGAAHRMLIDGGRLGTWPDLRGYSEQLPRAERAFALLVVTHIDRDHIEGMLPVMDGDDLPEGFRPADVWFNGWEHLDPLESFGAKQGERLSAGIVRRTWSWNSAYGGKAVCIEDEADLPVVDLPGGARITILSPDREQLLKLRETWRKECEAAGIVPGEAAIGAREELDGYERLGPLDVDELASSPFTEDRTVPNGSSIAFLFEHAGKRVLFGADAHPSRIVRSIGRLLRPGETRLEIDACKLCHHGSRNNVSPALIDALDCPLYLISTNGSVTKHPHPEAVARVISRSKRPVELVFNYRTTYNDVWDSASTRRRYRYTTRYPSTEGFQTISL